MDRKAVECEYRRYVKGFHKTAPGLAPPPFAAWCVAWGIAWDGGRAEGEAQFAGWRGVWLAIRRALGVA